jgi:DNA-binding TFAR19-related protein (PDSD5 family)
MWDEPYAPIRDLRSRHGGCDRRADVLPRTSPLSQTRQEMSEPLRLRLTDLRNKRVYDLKQYQAKQEKSGKLNPAHNEREAALIAMLDELLAEAAVERGESTSVSPGTAYAQVLDQLIEAMHNDSAANGIELQVQLKAGRFFNPVTLFRAHDTYIEHRLTRRERQAKVKALHEKIFGAMHWYNVSKPEYMYINGLIDHLPNPSGAY